MTAESMIRGQGSGANADGADVFICWMCSRDRTDIACRCQVCGVMVCTDCCESDGEWTCGACSEEEGDR